MINTTKTRRVYKAVSKTGVTDTYSTVRADREYNYAIVYETKAVKETRKIEVPTERFFKGEWIPHMCYRYETDYLDQADGRGEYILSFHTTEDLARKALPTGKEVFNAYIVRTVRVK